MLATLTRPVTTTRVVATSADVELVLGDEAGQAGRQGVVGDRRDLVIGVGGLGGEGGGFGLGGGEVRARCPAP